MIKPLQEKVRWNETGYRNVFMEKVEKTYFCGRKIDIRNFWGICNLNCFIISNTLVQRIWKQVHFFDVCLYFIYWSLAWISASIPIFLPMANLPR